MGSTRHWNDSYVKWVFPSDYFLVEDDWLWTQAETSFFETRYVPMSIGRRTNESIFEADGYQLAEFNVTFEDMNFDYYGGMVIAKEYSLVNASFVPDTFYTDAPLLSGHPFSRKNENYIEFNLDKSQLQANKTYNFSVIVHVDLKGDNPAAILYKPYYSIWLGSNSSCVTGPLGKNITVPSEMLPEHIHYASASTNVSNTWCLCLDNQLVISLKKVSESLEPKSEIHVHKEEWLSTYDTHIDHNHLYNFTAGWSASVWEVENLDNVTYTITTPENFTYSNNWELYQNGTENTFISPPTVEGQNYTWLLPVKDRIGSVINFALDSSQTVQDNPWADLDVNTTNEEGYTRVNITFKPVIPLDCITLYAYGDQIIDVSAYPSEFEIEMLTSSYVMFYSGDIYQNWVYNFSVLVDTPSEVELWLEASFGWVVESPSNIITLPVAELGSVTVKADVPVIWEHCPTLPQYAQDITIEFEEEKPTHTDVGVTVDIELSNSTEMAPLLPPGTNLTNAIVIKVNVTDDTPGNSTDDAYTDITINVGELDAETCAVYKEGSGFLPEVDDVATLPTVKPPGDAKFSRDVTNNSVIVRLYVGDPLLGVIPPLFEGVFDTGKGTYPSIMGTHEGKITPNKTIIVHKMYTYPCAGTGGHTKYVSFYGAGLDVNKTWNGYIGDYHYIIFNPPITLQANTTYDYEIRTGSYPQIIHERSLPTLNGTINCTQFTDANGRTYSNWIPAIKLE
jgi:hypothetical protein